MLLSGGDTEGRTDDNPFVDEEIYNSFDVSHAPQESTGRPVPRFDNLIMGWDALSYSLPSQPGIVEQVGGVALFTRTDIFDRRSLLLQRISARGDNPQRFDSLDLYTQDIPVLMRLIRDTAQSKDIENYVNALRMQSQ